jgi:hypothetical protein
MGDTIKTALEIALEKAAMLDELTDKEKEEIANKKKLEPAMAGFYKGKSDPEQLWQELKDGSPALLKQAQLNLIESLKFNLDTKELQRRSKGIIAVESLKKEQKTSVLQQSVKMLEAIQHKAETEKNQVFNEFKKAVESNPQARNKVVEQGGQKVVVKLTVEDAIMQHPQWRQVTSELAANYEEQFEQAIEALKNIIS